MLEVVLVDDEAAARRVLREYCALEPDLKVVGEYGDGRTALEAIRTHVPHVLLLDVKMESLDGIELVRSLDVRTLPLIVFVTAYDHYALEAFELSAVDYLLKPFDRERFRHTIDRVRRRVAAETAAQRREVLEALLERIERAQHARIDAIPRILVGTGSEQSMLDVELIELATAERNYVQLTVGRKTFPVRGTLQQTEKTLQVLPILRISRSRLVNMNHVRSVSRTPRGDFILVLAGGTTVTSSEGFRESVRRHLDRFRLPPG